MREDELQVLGISNNRKKYKMWAIIAVCLAIMVMLSWLWATAGYSLQVKQERSW